MEWKKSMERDREVKSAKAYNDLMKRPKSPGSPTSSQGSSFNFSMKSVNKERATTRNTNSKFYDRNFTEKSR